MLTGRVLEGMKSRGIPSMALDMPKLRGRPPNGRGNFEITYDLEMAAREIADIYKRRRQVKLFFKWIKQILSDEDTQEQARTEGSTGYGPLPSNQPTLGAIPGAGNLSPLTYSQYAINWVIHK
jgi:hypothetical protein